MMRQKVIAVGEIFLLISMSFAIAFIFSESFGARVSAETLIAGQNWNPSTGAISGPAVTSAQPAATSGWATVAPNGQLVPASSRAATHYITQSGQVQELGKAGYVGNYNPTTGMITPGTGGGTSAAAGAVGTSGTAGTANLAGISGAHLMQGAQLAGGGTASVIAPAGATQGIAVQGGQAYAATWSQSANAWQTGAALTPQQLSAIPAANTYYPGMSVADAQALGWHSQSIGLANGQSVPAMVSSNGQVAAPLTADGQALGGQTATWNAAANGGKGAWAGGPSAPAQPSIMGSIFGGQAFGAGSATAIWAGALVSGAVWGLIVGGAAYFIAGMFGLSKKQATSIGLGLGAGTFAGATLYLVGANSANTAFAATPGSFGAFATSGFGAILIGAGIAAAIILLTWKTEKKELVRFECNAWEPPTGGAHCDDCNDDPLMPCSEYRCRSLGQACQIVNPGTTEEKCVWVSKGDTAAPHILPWNDALDEGLNYYPDAKISPPNRGFIIKDHKGSDGCLPAFSNLQFGIETDEPAQCRIDYDAKKSYSEMQFLFGESSLFTKEHTQILKVPNTNEVEGNFTPEIGIDGEFKLWVRCVDANGNGEDSAAVAFSFCVDKGPDTTQPTIEGSSIESGKPVQFDADAVPIEIYVNEPSECKWSRLDKAYSDMENVMDCGTDSYQINADLNYVCASQLTGIENRKDNYFYFRCKDKTGNIMATSYPLLLKGTEELTITDVGPNGKFVGSTTTIPVTLTVETAHGADNGKATCSFSNSQTGKFIKFKGDDGTKYLHNQSLDLTAGNYQMFFRCVDGGGNLATSNTTFNVTTDTSDPLITRVYRDGNVLKIVTSEEAKCYYSNTNCDYDLENGLVMLYEDATKRNVHTVEWNEASTYYIKCEDFNGNQPRPDQCQITTKPSEW